MTNSLLLSINTIYLSIPAGGLTSNVIWVGGGLGGRKESAEKEGESGVQAKESTEQAEERNWEQMAHELNRDVEA